MFREEVILPLVEGKDVLDCGGVDHWAFELKSERGDWLHALIAERARSCLGVDILESRVDEINQRGEYRFVKANVEQLALREEFDVVVAGEIVEHIYNMGLFLDSAWRALRSDGKLIITTPNRYALSTWMKTVAKGSERVHPEHTVVFSPQTLEYLGSRHCFKVEDAYCMNRPAEHRLVENLRSVLVKLRPILGDQLVLVASKQPHQSKYDAKW